MTKGFRRVGVAPTISDVADAAGVSAMTVSRVINRDARVRDETRERVDAAIARLNYIPNPAARVLAGAVRTRIGLVYGNPSSAYLSEVLLGCLAEASRADVQLMLENCVQGYDAAGMVDHLRATHIDGVVLPPPFCDAPDLVDRLLAAGLPIVQLATGAPVDGAFAVTVDDAAAAADMTRSLIAKGHRRIGFIVGAANQTTSTRRLNGYRASLAEAGIPCDDALIAQGDFSYGSGLIAADTLLRLASRPTAIFASNDDMAAAVIATAHRRHLDVPGDVSVCGFDDTPLATTILPTLTTVRQPVADMAQAAVALLAEAARRLRAGRRPEPECRVLPHAIIERQSVAAISQ